MPPGTLALEDGHHTPEMRVFGYDASDFSERTDVALSELPALRERWAVTWIHVVGLADVSLVERLGESFGIHRLALEDVLNTRQRPKVDNYGAVTHVVVRMIERPEVSDTEQLTLFIGTDFVLSFEEHPGDLFGVLRQRIRSSAGPLRHQGPDFLMYAILDVVIDAYFPVLERLGDELDLLEDRIHQEGEHVTVELRMLKRQFLELRRALWPTREVVANLMAGACPLVTAETRTYLRDCHDHCAQLLDLVATYRELTSDLVDLQLSLSSRRMNEIMKVLTVISTLFIPLTFICSIYGMNFDTRVSPWNMPELEWAFGYPFALGLMAAIASGLLFFFRRKGWI